MKHKNIKKIFIIAIPLIAISIISCIVYYNKYLSWDYDVTSFGGYNNNPNEISKIEIGFHEAPARPHHEMYLVTVKDRKNIKKITDILDKMKFNDGDIVTYGGVGGNLFMVMCYNKENRIAFSLGIAGLDGGCMVNGVNSYTTDPKHEEKLGEIYLDLRGEIPK
ncbi:MAG: hypothetical protein HFH68_16260 [Lachnospiraceae bacterium]|nr:hypothetical protein [Lachnospiraceae bacterium]